MDDEKYASYPEEIQVREFKVNGSVYVTTFFDANKYKKNELVKIYKMRWHVEINLKNIKSVMNIAKKWTMPGRNWNEALNRFVIEFGDRISL